jgi:glycosyltransferase involved in cell wall biosynthesis
MKKTVLYIIDSLEKGGAEIMVVSPLAEIHRHYKIILVTLRHGNVFNENELICDKRYCLDMANRFELLNAVKKLKKIIHENNITLVHSFLYWSSIVARMACGNKIPYTFSLATMMNSGVYQLKKWSGYTLLLDRFTYRNNHFVISPTNEVLHDFNNSVGLKGKSIVLYNFVKREFFDHQIDYTFSKDKLKLVAVGNLKSVKNYQLIIEAFKLLGDKPVSLDIYGEGPERSSLQRQINKYNLPIELKGSHENIFEILPLYDAYVMSSFIEGFGVSAAEAMAVGLPLLLSDIKVLREISMGTALFFDPFKPESFVSLLNKILAGDTDLKNLSEKVKEIAKNNYTQEKYLRGLFEVYQQIVPGSVLEGNNIK